MRSLFSYLLAILTLFTISGFIWVKVDAPPEAPPQRTGSGTVLFVVGNTSLSNSDQAVKDYVEGMGFTVTVIDDDQATSNDASNKVLVMISSSSNNSNQVNSKFKDVLEPVISWEASVYDDMKMTGTTIGTDYGQVNSQELTIVSSNDNHYMTSGFTGSVNVTTSSQQMTYGYPSDGAQKIAFAGTGNSPNKYSIFAYEAGAPMVGMNAPARRVGMFLYNDSGNNMTSDGWTLLETAIDWATNQIDAFTKETTFIRKFGWATEAHYGILPLSDGNYMMMGAAATGSGNQSKYNFHAAKINSRGIVTNATSYHTSNLMEDSQNRGLTNIFTQDGNGDLIFAIEEDYDSSNGGARGMPYPAIIKIDDEGNKKYLKRIEDYYYHVPAVLEATSTSNNSGNILLATTSFHLDDNQVSRFYILDQNGTPVKATRILDFRAKAWEYINSSQSIIMGRMYSKAANKDSSLVFLSMNPSTLGVGATSVTDPVKKFYRPTQYRRIHGYDLAKLNNGNLVAVGVCTKSNEEEEAFWMIINSSGDDISKSVFDIDGLNTRAFTVAATNDGGFIVGGGMGTDVDNNSTPFMAKFSSNGSLEWTRKYDIVVSGQSNQFSVFYHISQTNDGGYIIGGGRFTLNTGNYPGLVVKTNSQGYISEYYNCKVSNANVNTDPLVFDETYSIDLGYADATDYIEVGNFTNSITETNIGFDTVSANYCPVPNLAPIAIITHESPNGLTVQFNGGASYDPEGKPLDSYSWNFDDGTTGTGITPSHTYSSAGTYTVELTVKDDNQQFTSTTKNVTVSVSNPNTPPVAIFEWEVDNSNPLKINFDADSSYDVDPGDVLTYSWTYGDGASLTNDDDPYADHPYNNPGTYTVILTVEDSYGATDQDTQEVFILDPNAITDAWLEAECAERSANSNWQVASDNTASNDAYITPTTENLSGNLSSNNADDMITFRFNIDHASDQYKLFARSITHITNNDSEDSYWVRVNPIAGQTDGWQKWNMIASNSNDTYEWDQLHNGDNTTEAVYLNLIDGENVLQFHVREIGPKLDKIYITLAGPDPTGEGESAQVQCQFNNPPEIQPIPDQVNKHNESVSLQVEATDPDAADQLTYSQSGLPDGLSINSSTGEITGNISFSNSLGDYPVTITVADDGNPSLTDDTTFTWTIIDANLETDLWLEAECAEIAPEWSTGQDANASNGTYMYPPQAYPNIFTAPDTSSDEYLKFAIDVDYSGDYKVFVKSNVNGTSENSIWMRSSQEDIWTTWNDIEDNQNNFIWDQVHNGDNTSSFHLFPFTANQTNYLYIHRREANVQIDKIFVTLTGKVENAEDQVPTACVPPNGVPTASLVATPNAGVYPLAVVLDGSESSNDVQTYYWDAGDGSPTRTTTTDTIQHTYTAIGTYTAQLIVEDDINQKDTAYTTITVTEQPVNEAPVLAAIPNKLTVQGTYDSLQISATDPNNDTLTFTASSLPQGLNLNQSTGYIDGIVTADTGVYNITIIVYDNQTPSLSDTGSFTWTVIAPTPPPSSDSLWLEAECTFLGTSWNNIDETDASNGEAREFIAANVWNGSHITADDQIEFNFNVPTSGNYTVYGRVKGVGGGNSMWVKMDDGTWAQQDVDSDDTYKWYDMGSHSLNTGSHNYYLAGRETGVKPDKIFVTLNGTQPVNTTKGPIGTNCGPQPNQGPTAIIDPNPYVGNAPLTLTFDGSMSTDDKGIVQYEWEIGGVVTTGTQDSMVASFPKEGTYQIKLTVWDEEGLWDEAVADITLGAPTSAPTGEILFIVGDENLSINPGDQAVYNRLTTDLGYTVIKEKDSEYDPTDLQNKILVIISSSIGSGNIYGSNEQSLIDTQIPILNYEAAYHDDLKLVAGSSNSGTVYGEMEIQIVNPNHFMAIGLNASQIPYSGSGSLNWGEPTSSAIVVARDPEFSHPVIFGYETGSQMDGINAPARRVGFFLHDDKADNLNPSIGWPLFDAAVCWALGCDLFVPICTTSPLPTIADGYTPPTGSVSPTASQNYIRSTSFRGLGGSEPVHSVGYFDGLGRNILSVDVQGSPMGKDVLAPVAYDAFGRQPIQQLPIVSGTGGAYTTPGSGAFYNNTNFPYIPGADLNAAFSTTEFEASPLNRVITQTGPGDAGLWGGSHIKTEYKADGEYYVTKVTDENGAITETATDKLGRTVYKKSKVDGVDATTHFKYDDFGNVQYVIQPMGFGNPVRLNGNTFEYEYDERQRVKRKWIPGTNGWTAIYYDNLDRVVATMDPNGKVLSTQYDDLGRPIKTGYDISPDEPGNDPDGSIATLLSETFYDTYPVGMASFAPAAPPALGQTPLLAPQMTNKVKGKVTAVRVKVLETSIWLETVTYYDDYGREIQTIADNHKGGKDKVTNFYNFAGELLATVLEHNNNNGTAVKVEKAFDYDHRGRLLRITQSVNGDTPEIIGQYTYNELGQLQGKRLSANSCEDQLQLVDYTYNIRGWMTGINLAQDATTGNFDLDLPCPQAGVSQDLFAMKLNYNDGFDKINGVGDPMYNGNISGIQWQSAVQPLNTNLSACQKRGYGFKYDALNRLRDAKYAAGDTYIEEVDNFNVSLIYDYNGNIITLNRRGLIGENSYGDMDALVYTYTGNRVTSISEGAASTAVDDWEDQFIGGTRNYGYDANGNITSDGQKTLVYNHLNKPNSITLPGGTITYKYAADGTKLQMISPEGTYDYIGGFFYKDNVLQHFSHEEGRVFNNAGEFRYEYNITDHLGNVRVSFTDLNTDGVIDTDPAVGEVLQEDHYYPFGLRLGGLSNTSGVPNRYRYNGKELQDELGLGWYDYGARMYDPAIGRWNGVDALAEDFSAWSPYNYVYNNPVLYTDPDGNSGVATIDEENGTITITSHLIFYGDGADENLATETSKNIQTLWNNAGGTAIVNGKEYTVNFSVTGEYVADLSGDEVAANTDHTNNYIKIVTDENDLLVDWKGIKSSAMDEVGGNTGVWLRQDIVSENNTTAAHEFGHGLTLEHPYEIDFRGKGQPGIMAERGTVVDADFTYDPSKGASILDNLGNTSNTLDPDKRRVIPQNIRNLNLNRSLTRQVGKKRKKRTQVLRSANIGHLTNIYH